MLLHTRLWLPACWLLALAAGFGYFLRYESTAGRAAKATAWPAQRVLGLDESGPTLVLFAHPECPCTRASLRTLSETMGRSDGRARLYVVVVGSPGLDEELSHSEIATLAREVPGASVVFDHHGETAKRFGAATSGQLFAFSPEGQTLYRGGVTLTRGHEGPSPGSDAVAAILEGRTPQIASAPVYGCAFREASR